MLAYAFPYRRFAAALAGVRARLRVDADRYSLIVSDFHRLLLAGLPGALRKISERYRELGKALGVTFQQIQKYENGGNAVASTRIPDLCKILQISPNDLFGVSARMDRGASQLGTWGS